MPFPRAIAAPAAMALAALALPSATPAFAEPVQQQGPESRDKVLDQVQRHLRATNALVADFSQTDRSGKVLTGTMTLKRPGRIRFEYERGVPQLIVADGNSLYFIDYSVRQVERWPIGNSPLAVLLDPKKDIARFAKPVPTGDPRVLSIEVHDPDHPEYGRITMVFARDASKPAGLLLQGWVALDSQSNRTTIRLSNQRYNGTVSDRTFNWRDPRGTPGPRRR